MIRRAMAVRYNGKPERGRTQPVYATVMTDDDVEHDVVLKFANGETTIEHLANEILACMLATDVAVPVMTPFLVLMEPEFIGSIEDASVRGRMVSGHVAFGSTYAATQWHLWESFNKVAASQVEAALSIFAFDGFIANNDRRPGNPNLLVKGDEWRAIDHDAAFMFRMKFAPRCEPWRVGNLDLMRSVGADSEHVFATHLRGKASEKTAHIGAAWRGLTDARFAQYDATLPEEWDSVRGPFGEAIEHLKRVRDNIDACLAELERVLS